MVAICQVVLRWSQEGRHQLSSNRKFTKHSWRNQLSTTILEQNVQHCRTDLLQVALCQHNIATPRHCRIGCSCNLVLYGSVRFWHLFCENPLLKIKRRFKTISSRKAKNFSSSTNRLAWFGVFPKPLLRTQKEQLEKTADRSGSDPTDSLVKAAHVKIATWLNI